jgi:hypothetical protein
VARLIYSAIASLDGYVADEHGDFGWAAPDEEVHSFANDLERAVGTQRGASGGLRLELLEQRRFGGGVVYLRYRPMNSSS